MKESARSWPSGCWERHFMYFLEPEAHHRVHNSPLLIPVLNQINTVHVLLSYFCKIHFSIILSSMSRLSSILFPLGIPTKILYEFHFSPLSSTCPSHLILHHLITQIIFGEDWKLWSYSSCSFLSSPIATSFSDLNTFLITLFSKVASLWPFLNMRDQVSHATIKTDKILMLYILTSVFLVSKLTDKRFCTKW